MLFCGLTKPKVLHFLWILLRMQLPGLIGFTILIVAFEAKDQNWNISVNSTISAESTSSVTILCNFSYPEAFNGHNVNIYWKIRTPDKSDCSKNDKDPRPFIFHPNDTCVLEKYRKRTELIGDKNKGNCSLKIQNVTENILQIYVRVNVKNENYSYIKNLVSIYVKGSSGPVKSEPGGPTGSPMYTTQRQSEATDSTVAYGAIFGTVAALLIILLVAGCLIYKKYKRWHSFTREESGYYANFSRATSNPPKREVACNTHDKKLPEPKATDDPVYINVEATTDHTEQDHAENIYANVDYSK